MALLRESPIRGRRLRIDEALMERFLMSPVGFQFLLQAAPRIDKVLIPRTNGRFSSLGLDKIGSSRRPAPSLGSPALTR
jgi:hypothetical protein